MLRKIQIRVILVFLIIGILIIGISGYINYLGIESTAEKMQISANEVNLLIETYQGQIKITTIISVLIFGAICILARYICNRKNNIANYKADK